MSKYFSENDIRPDELMKKQQEFYNQDIAFLQSKKNEFVEVCCPACGSTDYHEEFEKNTFKYKQCNNCGMLYISPRPTVEILRVFYPNSPNYKFFNDYIFPASKEIRREKIFKPRVQKILKYCDKYNVKKDKLIEIGTGYGLFCEEMVKTKAFKDVAGVEASNALAETCGRMGFRLYNGLLENLEINEKFDVAVAFEVIEHIFDPKIFVEKISDILNKGGIFMLTFPNWEGFDISVLREYSGAVDHEHLNYFTANSIAIMLSKIGFQVLEVSTPGELDVDIVSKTVQKEKLKLDPFLKKLCIDKQDTFGENFQSFLRENKLSSHMMVVAIKQ